MELVSIVISAFFLIVSSIIYLKSQLPKQTIQNQRELIETYEKRLKALEDQAELDKKQHLENVKAIAELQGQLKAYKEIPLKKLADAVEKTEVENVEKFKILQQIATTQSEILKLIKASNDSTRVR